MKQTTSTAKKGREAGCSARPISRGQTLKNECRYGLSSYCPIHHEAKRRSHFTTETVSGLPPTTLCWTLPLRCTVFQTSSWGTWRSATTFQACVWTASFDNCPLSQQRQWPTEDRLVKAPLSAHVHNDVKLYHLVTLDIARDDQLLSSPKVHEQPPRKWTPTVNGTCRIKRIWKSHGRIVTSIKVE